MTIKQLIKKCHKLAIEKGFWDKTCWWCGGISKEDIKRCSCNNNIFIPRNKSELLMLIVSELGEACEALRNNNDRNFKEEIADTFIRLADLCGGLGIDIEKEIIKKIKKNKKRPYKHGKEF